MPRVQLPATTPKRRAWNKGQIIGQKRPLLPKQVWAIRARLEMAGHQRDLALFNVAIDSKLRDWVLSIGLDPSGYGTHTLRRTKAAEIYRKIGNLRTVQLLLGHRKIDSTVRYLGVELEDALSIFERIDI